MKDLNNDESLFVEAGLLCEVCIILPSRLHLTAKPVQNLPQEHENEMMQNGQLPSNLDVVQNRPEIILRLAQCRPKSSHSGIRAFQLAKSG